MQADRLQPLMSTRILAILQGLTPDEVIPVSRALAAGGIRAIEVTLDSPGSLESIRILRQLAGPSMLIGAGTVLDSGAAERALRAGAQMLATPGLAPDVAAIAREERMPIIMGGLTPSEVLAAHRAGSTMVNLFPATLYGPEYIQYVRGPLAHIPLLVSGGISTETARAYLDAGAAAVGVTGLVSREDLATGNWPNLTTRARALMEVVAG